MATSLKILPWRGKTNFEINRRQRVGDQLRKFYEGKANAALDSDFQIEVLEHSVSNGNAPDEVIRNDNDHPLIIFHPEGDLKRIQKDRLKEFGNVLSTNYAWKDVLYYNYWGFDYLLYLHQVTDGNPIEATNTENTFAPKFLCMNGRPEWHRFYLLELMNQRNLIENNLVSFLNRYDYLRRGTKYDTFKKIWQGESPYVDSIIQSHQELTLDLTTNEVVDDDRQHEDWIYKESSLSIVTETYGEAYRGCFITEKGWKPIANCHFQIFVGQPGLVQAFRDFGFDMFDDIIDHRYDTIVSDTTRYEKALTSAERFIKTVESLPNKDELQERLKLNQTKFLNMKITEDEVQRWLNNDTRR